MGLSNGQYVVTFMISNECITDSGLSVVALARLSHRVACLGCDEHDHPLPARAGNTADDRPSGASPSSAMHDLI